MRSAKDSMSIRERAYAFIQGRIASRQFPAGSSISDVAIAEEMGSSRTPVREALRQLLTEGYLTQTANGGLEVVRLTRHEIRELFEIREALELHAIRKIACTGLPEPDLARSRNILGEMIALQNQLLKSGEPGLDVEQLRRYEVFDVAFHTVLIRASDNLRLLKSVNELRFLIGTFTMRHKGHDITELTRLNEEHRKLLDLITERNPEQAAEVLSCHIQNSMRVRLEEYGQWERESSLRENVPDLTRLHAASATGQD
jgi:DNA-binding GntR family transcriptional regulator